MTVQNEPRNETAFRRKIYVIGWILFLGGSLLIVAAYRKGSATEYMKDGGFHLATAGLVLLVVEWSLRGEFIAVVRESIHESLQRWAAGRVVVRDVLDLTFISPEDRELLYADNLSTLVDRLCALRNPDDWAKDVYKGYLSDVILNVRENAESLSALSAAREQSTPPREIKLFSPAQRTDQILEKLMAKLYEGDRYDVFSDVESWANDQLEKFFNEHERAASRKVVIRRIFIVRNEDWTHGKLRPGDAGKILSAHLAIAEKTPEQIGYHVRLLDTSRDWELLERVNPEIETDHYGIFIPAPGRHCIQVRVTKKNLSKLHLAKLDRGSEEIRDFRLLWEGLKVDLNDDSLKAAVARWESYSSNSSPSG